MTAGGREFQVAGSKTVRSFKVPVQSLRKLNQV